MSVRGSDLPGFRTRDDFTVHSAVLGNTHLFGARTTNKALVSFFRYGFLFDQRLNKNGPRTFGFNYDSASTRGRHSLTWQGIHLSAAPSPVRAPPSRTPMKSLTLCRVGARP